MRLLFSLLALTFGAANAGPLAAPQAVNATGYWYENIQHNGISAAIPNGKNWVVFRNVKDYGAKGDGTTDDTAAIQRAISTGDSTGTRDTAHFGSTGQPAVVYFPAGTYLVSSTINNPVGTVLTGDPTNRATIKAAASFTGANVVFGHDKTFTGLNGFFHSIRNLVLDSTAVPASRTIALLEWSVSQNNLLSNVLFNMPVGAATHTGITTQGPNSPLIINDLEFRGGGFGIQLATTQYHLKNLVFKNVQTGVRLVSVLQATAQGMRFEGCSVGIDASTGSGMLSLIDSSATNTSVVVSAAEMTASSVKGSLVLENVNVDSTVAATIKIGTTTTLTGSVKPGTAWIRGNTYAANSTTAAHASGQLVPVSRPATLVDPTTGSYPALPPPTYADVALSSFINVKTVAAHPVAGDGVTDDTAAIQAILKDAAAAGKLVFFPHGIYILTDTVVVPTGSRLVGEAWTQLSASGAKFADAKKPRVMLQIGAKRGDKGVVQMSDFILTVADVLPGAVLMQVNAAGEKPGDVGFWNCHFRVGGAIGSKVRGEQCAKPETCMAARLTLHLTDKSSSYWENVWSWTADHDLDSTGTAENGVYPAAAGGFLIESKKGTWLLGMGVEHNVLYQVNINKAENVFIGLQQGEAPYWQGNGTTLQAPAPWTQTLLNSDPDFAWCEPNDAMCRAGLYQIITKSKNLNIYSSGFWNFVAGPSRTFCADDCQDNAALYESNEKLFVYGLTTINNKNMILELKGKTATPVATRAANTGGIIDGLFRSATVAAFFR